MIQDSLTVSWLKIASGSMSKSKTTSMIKDIFLAIQMMFSFMLADETSSLKLCKNCMKAFFAKNNEEDFCCTKCEAEYDDEVKE